MKSYKEFCEEEASAEEFMANLLTCPTILIFENDDSFSECIAEQILEEGRTYNLNKRHSIRFDKAHVGGQKDHTHFMLKGNEIGVINRDNTPSHGTDISKIPNSMIKAAKSRGFIEKRLIDQDAKALVESRLFPDYETLISDIKHLIEKIIT